jgi:PAS domain S-box-containing protein
MRNTMHKTSLLNASLTAVLFMLGFVLLNALISGVLPTAQVVLLAIGGGVCLGYFVWRVFILSEQNMVEETAVLRGENDQLRQKAAGLQKFSSVLREQREQYQHLFDYASDIIYILNLEGSVLYVNRVIEEIVGYRPEEVLGRHFLAFVTGIDEEYLWNQLKQGGIRAYEFSFQGKTQPVSLELNAHFLVRNGAPTAILGIARDVSARKQAQEELSQAVQAKTAFMNNMGHELRTPLSVIMGYADILGQDARLEEQVEYLALSNKIKQAAQQLHTIINDVMDITEIEIGQVSYLLEWFDVSDMVRQVVNQAQTAVDSNGNTLLLLLSPDIGRMFADRDKVRRILMNLLSNAAKFTHNGAITLSVHREQRPEGEQVVFQVMDTGIGIALDRQEAIFQAFNQGDNSFTRAYGGIGLGLTINQHYCRTMKGRIRVNSAPGEGATFTLCLPVEVTAVDSMFIRKE